MPSESAGQPSRDRLAVELSLNSGMRIDEVTNLRTWQILDFAATSGTDYSVHLMAITKTKGLKARHVEVPHWLLKELLAYIDRERNHAISAGRKYGLKKDTAALFVNGVSARQNAGKRFTADSLDDVFRRATVSAGLVRTIEKMDPVTGEPYLVQHPRFSFHCLRHSFAIWRYYAERQGGNPEPWKIIQSLLGHRALSTTTDLYLRATSVFEAQVSDEVLRFFGAIRNA
ncbi:MAG TPA: site-specific integrase [Gammaproteobacteria bacterium]|nr:site-specific integrase [Gammaproteobacteria bacterium]